jgi:hypothetical protein
VKNRFSLRHFLRLHTIAVNRLHFSVTFCIISSEKESKSIFQGMSVFRYDINIGSLVLSLFLVAACQKPGNGSDSGLPKIFPDAARALGPFSIHLEKSRESSVLSAARVKVEQGSLDRHVTLQIKMLHIQEQVTLSFLHQSQPLKRINSSQGAEGDQGFEILSQGKRIHERGVGSEAAKSVQEDSFNDPDGSMSEGTSGASRCMPPTAFVSNSAAPQPERRTLPLHDAAALFHLPLPRSIREASSLQVTGAGDAWSIINDALVWNPARIKSTQIVLSWMRDNALETRYPLQSSEYPKNLKARRIEKDAEESIAVQWSDGFVTIQETDVKPGAWLELQYDVPISENSFQLPQIPAFGNTNILSFQQSCPRESFLLERNYLSWDCPQESGSLWAVSYSYRQPSDAWDFKDWPELSQKAPVSVAAFADAGEILDVEIESLGRVVPKIPPEASRICLRATWTSDLPH